MNLYRLADRLHKTVAEILDMTADEYVGWIAFSRVEKRKP